MKQTFTLIFILTAGILLAQPKFTAQDINGSIGDTFRVITTEYVAPGNAGANQTWDFKNLTTTNSTHLEYKDPKNTGNSSDFLAATVAATGDDVNYSYYNQGASSFALLGVMAGGVLIKYDDPEDWLRYPVEYNDTYTDTWGGDFKNGGVTFYRKGKTTVTVDGYGTLITPAGTYTDAIRVHFFQDYIDSNRFLPVAYENDQYMWYVKGISYPVLSTFEFTTFQGTVSTSSYVTTKQPTTGVNELNKSGLAVSMYPNPSTGSVKIYNENAAQEDLSWTVVDVTGKVHLSGNIKGTKNQEITLDLSDLNKGMYYVRFTTATKTQTSSLLLE